MKITFSSPAATKQGAIVVGVAADRTLLPPAADLDTRSGGTISRAMKASRFTGKKGQILEVLAPQGLPNSRVVLAGLGKPEAITARDIEDLGGSLLAALNGAGESSVTLNLETGSRDKARSARNAAHAAFGALLRSYRFDKYLTKQPADKKPSLKSIAVMTADAAKARQAFKALSSIAEGVFFTRDLVSEPANVIYPKSFVAEAKALEKLGVKIQVLGEKEMKAQGMGALLGVGQASVRESQLLVMRWTGDPKAKDKRPVAVVGKGVTFDTGGISIKPAANMEDMKWDMGGAGVVAGLMKVLAGRKAKANVVGVCGLVENMPDGNAQRPGDIVKSMSGQTIEVINTDAEGRLVLADALCYTQRKFKPKQIIDLATLTGAIIVALGNEHAGLFSNNDELSDRLVAAGKAVDEPLWRMPMGSAYDKAIDSPAADMKNVGNRAGGSITAAQFILRFIEGDTPWAHLDIAGVAWSSKDKPTVPKGGTGFGVRLLDHLIAEHFEG